MAKYVFYYRNMDIGGCQLLIAKLANEMKRLGHGVRICCEFITDEMKCNIADADETAVVLGGRPDMDKALSRFLASQSGDVRIIVFQWVDFLRLSADKAKGQKLLFYAVHYDTVNTLAMSSRPALQRARTAYVRPMLKRLLDTGSLIVMDEQTIEHTEKLFGALPQQPQIVRLPVDISDSDLDLAAVSERLASGKRNILAVARAEFPFKGYLIGLVKLFAERKLPDNYTLTIVSYGDDIAQLERAYEECPDDIKERITLLGKTDYSELKALFRKAFVYAGMGTTLLDASKYGTPAVTVEAYCNEARGDVYFSDRPELMALESGTEERFIELVTGLEELTEEELTDRIRNTFETVKTMYSTVSVARQIDSAFGRIKAEDHRQAALTHSVRRAFILRRKKK